MPLHLPRKGGERKGGKYFTFYFQRGEEEDVSGKKAMLSPRRKKERRNSLTSREERTTGERSFHLGEKGKEVVPWEGAPKGVFRNAGKVGGGFLTF